MLKETKLSMTCLPCLFFAYIQSITIFITVIISSIQLLLVCKVETKVPNNVLTE